MVPLHNGSNPEVLIKALQRKRANPPQIFRGRGPRVLGFGKGNGVLIKLNPPIGSQRDCFADPHLVAAHHSGYLFEDGEDGTHIIFQESLMLRTEPQVP